MRNPKLLVRLLSLFALLHSGLLSAAVHQVGSVSELQNALNVSKPGDSVIIANGNYQDVSLFMDAEGTSDAPVVITAESKGGVIISGKVRIVITGRHIHLSSLVFRNCIINGNPLIDLDPTESCRISDMLFEHSGGNRPVIEIRSGSKRNIISNNKFIDIAGRSIHVQVNGTIRERGVPEGNIIRGNLFKDIPPLGDNGRETVKIGQTQPEFGHIKTRTLVENNQFIRCNGESEIISNKASSNIYRGNTFIDCEGEMVMRGGHDCLIENNHFVGCSGGIRLSGTGHTVRWNTIVNSKQTGIRLLYGMTIDQGGHYQAVSNCEISRNTIINAGRMGIFIGDGRNKDWKEKGIQKFAPENNRFTNNLIISGDEKFLYADHAPDNVVENNSFENLSVIN